MRSQNTSSQETEVNPEEFDMIMMSFDFIRYNRDITNDCLPDILLKFWSVPDFTINSLYKPQDPQALVFMFVLKLYFDSPKEMEKMLNSFGFSVLFYNFQVVLAATAYSRKSHIPIRPFQIFNVDHYILPALQRPGVLIREYNRITKQRK